LDELTSLDLIIKGDRPRNNDNTYDQERHYSDANKNETQSWVHNRQCIAFDRFLLIAFEEEARVIINPRKADNFAYFANWRAPPFRQF
jgi:hypothetical protein